MQAWRNNNPDKYRANLDSKKIKLKNSRTKILERFESKCLICGFTDWRTLQIDHINGGGAKHRRSFSSIHRYYEFLLNLDDKILKMEYQCLCANCNWIKKYENIDERGRESKFL